MVTNNGAIFDANGKLGGCYSFDGSHYLQSNKQIGEGWKEITFACWVYLNEVVLTSGSWYRILGIGAHTRAHLDIASNNTLRLFVSQTGTTSGLGVYSTTVGQAGKWYHLCGVLGNNQMSIYINGLKENEIVINSNSITYTNADYFRVGSITSGNAFNGKICDVRVYDHALSPFEVKQISQGLILHYPLNNNGWGQKNLIKNNLIRKSGNEGGVTFSNSTLGNEYVSISGTVTTKINQWLINLTSLTNITNTTITISTNEIISNSVRKIFLSTTKNGNWYRDVIPPLTASKYFTVILKEGETPRYLRILSQKGQIINSNLHFKLEISDKPTPWCPNEADELATSMGLNNNIQYDTSGYGNNGTKNNIIYSSDTPKYNVSSVFNGSNSYIKVNSTNWMIKGMTALTVNFWAKTSSWPANTRLISCTESGGFNLESGNSGYWRFPVHVYTNSGQTSATYKYDSNEIKIADLIPNEWNMITLVYDGTGTRTYLNGELHHTYTNVSYGISFNTNARLFLGCEASTASPASPYFNGMESDFRVYATALSADDVKSLYQNSAYIDNQGNIYGAVYEEV